MKRRLLSIVYLVNKKTQPTFTTATINSVLNKIPCEQDAFFRLSTAETFVLREMSQYPATAEQ